MRRKAEEHDKVVPTGQLWRKVIAPAGKKELSSTVCFGITVKSVREKRRE